MPRHSFHQRAVTGLCVLLAGMSAACGGGGSSLVATNPAKAMANAQQRTADAGTVSLSLSATGTSGTGSADSVTGAGAFDFAKNQGRFSLKTSQLPAAIDLVVTAETIYLKLPGPLADAAKPWVSVPVAGPEASAGSSGIAGGINSLASGLDPRATLSALGATARDLKKVGAENVRGVATTHLRGTIDLSEAALAKLPPERQKALRSTRAAVGSDSYPVDVWLDSVGRVRRLDYSKPQPAGTAGPVSKVRIELYDFGAKINVDIPPASQVRDAASVLSGLSGGASG